MQPFVMASHLRKVEENIHRRKEELKRFLREKERQQTHHKISLADACKHIQTSTTTIRKVLLPNEVTNFSTF